MIIDAQNLLAGSYAGSTATWTGATVGTTAAATVSGTNVVNLTSTNVLKDMGSGKTFFAVIIVTEAVTSAGACNVTFKLVSDSTTNLTTSPTTHWTSGAIAKATLVAGYTQVVALPRQKTYEQYLGVTTTPDTTDTTAGKYVCFLTQDPEVLAQYAKNYTIS